MSHINVTNQTFSDGGPGGSAAFWSIFHMLWKKTQPSFTKKESQDGTLRILSRIERPFINISVAEGRDFRCHAHVTDDLGDRSLPSDHVAIRSDIELAHEASSGPVLVTGGYGPLLQVTVQNSWWRQQQCERAMFRLHNVRVHQLSRTGQIIVNLAHGSIAEREDAIHGLPAEPPCG